MPTVGKAFFLSGTGGRRTARALYTSQALFIAHELHELHGFKRPVAAGLIFPRITRMLTDEYIESPQMNMSSRLSSDLAKQLITHNWPAPLAAPTLSPLRQVRVIRVIRVIRGKRKSCRTMWIAKESMLISETHARAGN